MAELTYKEFLNQVRSRIEGFSEAGLRELVLSWAQATTDSEKRYQFLAGLKPNANIRGTILDLI